jgi:RimJ/RimL family protein N-acetyltransferase
MAKMNALSTSPAAAVPPRATTPATNWREALPTLVRPALTLREPVLGDALALLTALPDGAMGLAVADPPPATVSGFERFIAQLQASRRSGLLACWVIVPADSDVPVGLIGVRAMDAQAAMVEGFAVVAEEFRGTPLFQTAGRMTLGCLFGAMRVHRVEFRIDVRNGRANGALRKLGATQEGLLRRARRSDGEFLDQVLWAIVATDWCEHQPVRSSSVH